MAEREGWLAGKIIDVTVLVGEAIVAMIRAEGGTPISSDRSPGYGLDVTSEPTAPPPNGSPTLTARSTAW